MILIINIYLCVWSALDRFASPFVFFIFFFYSLQSKYIPTHTMLFPQIRNEWWVWYESKLLYRHMPSHVCVNKKIWASSSSSLSILGTLPSQNTAVMTAESRLRKKTRWNKHIFRQIEDNLDVSYSLNTRKKIGIS